MPDLADNMVLDQTMNDLTTYGPVKEIATLALEAIYRINELGVDEDEWRDWQSRWLQLVQTPGGSHFPSSSVSASTLLKPSRGFCMPDPVPPINRDAPHGR